MGGGRPLSTRSTTVPDTNTTFTATVLGAPRIGPNRELKRAVEAYWGGRIDAAELHRVAADLRTAQLTSMHTAGLDSVPVGTFSYYDHVLDTAVLLGALPERVQGIEDELDRYFAAARGTDTVAPLEMTKWFDTNYHYLVPEIAAGTQFSLHPDKPLTELREAQALGIPARPVVVGPITFLKLAKAIDGADLLDRLEDLLPLYEQLLALFAEARADWVQVDEPSLVTDLSPAELAAIDTVYRRLAASSSRPKILVATYFGRLGEALEPLARTGVDAVAVDLVAGGTAGLPVARTLTETLIVAGVVDGHNVWRTDPDAALAALAELSDGGASVAVSSSCSLLHVPYSLEAETDLEPRLASWLAFGAEKVAEIVTLATAVQQGPAAVAERLEIARTALRDRRADPRLHVEPIRARLTALEAADTRRAPADQRRELQQARLSLPQLPTTTIGSYPQTGRIRLARAALRRGEIDGAEYDARMRAEIAEVVALQEDIGLDVLVHGEPERNDMVQYFAEQLDGFAATSNGWVQSYGTRCVRPPIIYGDVARPAAMTVEWISYAQSLTGKPVKGMLTGPVTILAWSFVRDDQPESDTARQIALAIRDETIDLEAAGTAIIQVDEPALRELLPLRRADQPDYLAWAVAAFRLATSGVADTTQVHTHLCYSEFGEIIGAIAELDADVTSVEAARSHMEVLDDLNAAGFDLGVGPGVYDIHSPRVPGAAEITESLSRALKAVPAQRLWVNPDCGLKTRGTDEVVASLRNMVTAATALRQA
ncbi:5-methyltetrahydropteroyltriglutamate--homocysteine S-methyltransferase [Nocardia sp. CA2R105]|uniref:5-methyltetrahydropteroyltriglutamate-- homocysteine S-methyltransferase n=1 Tax=Nocardia coffeae TaxID=2873381 RepID=UPI001CA697C0|nr:5-methyltetrahydropteroyltriglutamate--homocysteine S-methyltransferase [Nocardia coffeae]MBY8856123.1 5-methyltetrahydropteroyltriglutamate--homocysteine S-methyltransferase [Nocardia coffeae]